MREVAKWFPRNPFQLLFEPIIGTTTGIIQEFDVPPDGRVDHCDSCPDMTYWEGKLVHSCRLDEYRKFGQLVTILPNDQKSESISHWSRLSQN